MINDSFDGRGNTDSIEVLMADDNPGDVVLVREAAAQAGLRYRITEVHDGIEAVAYLRGTGAYAGAARPDLIVLDLNLPRRTGREVLGDIQPDPVLSAIPLVALSSSRSELDRTRPQMRSTQTAMAKPATFAAYVEMLGAIEAFRLSAAKRRGAGPTEVAK
jgi:two-component system, chemotaxis family, response regulator Rcp1